MGARHPPTFLQERIFRLAPAQMDHDVSLSVWHLVEELDDARCEEAVRELARRQPALRSSLRVDGSRIIQVVHDEAAFPVAHVRLAEVPPELARRRLAGLAEAAVRRPVSLTAAPWGSLTVVELGVEEHVLIWRMGHAGWDAFSAGVLAREFASIFAAAEHAAAPAVDIGAWSADQRRAVPSPSDAAYWQRALAGSSAPAPTSGCGYLGVELRGPPIAAAALNRLAAWARAEGATLPAALAVLMNAAMGRRSRDHGWLLAVFDANRESPALQNVIGCVINLLLIPMPPLAGHSFNSLLRETRDALFGAYDHKLPIEHQLRFLPASPDGCRTVRTFATAALNVHPRIAGASRLAAPVRLLPCMPSRRVLAEGPWTGSNLVLNAAPRSDGGLTTWWTFNSRVLRPAAVSRVAARFAALVTSVSLDDGSRSAA